MKLVTLKQQSLYIIILLFQYGVLYPQNGSLKQSRNIYPSAIFQIQKVDSTMLNHISPTTHWNYESEAAEHFKTQSRRRQTEPSSTEASSSFPSSSTLPGICQPIVQTNFEGNPLTPFYLPPVGYYASEVNIAISNAGKMVSISNGWIRYYDQTGALTFSDSLYHFGNSLIDVHVMYDPKKDRFIFISQYGYTNFSNAFQVIGVAVAFSKSNNPSEGWNYYFLPDTGFNDNAIGDYPLLGISDDEIFITDLRTNNGGNITHSAIVQIDKNAGYAGASTISMQQYKVKLSSTTKGTLIPASGGSTSYGPNMYFMMGYESGHPSNKYYVLEITNTIASGQAVLKTYGPVQSNITYSASGTIYQPGGILLQGIFVEGDAFVQNVFYENGIMQFCQNSLVNGKAGVVLGRINGIPNNLSCTAKTVSDPNLYLQYPSIVYSGNSPSDNSAIVGIQHTGDNTYPGLSAIYVNSNFDISPLTLVKAGVDTINGRWGDYSGTCRRYNHPGEVWFEGQYGSAVFPKINWITKLNKPSNCEGQSIIPTHLTEKINPNLIIYPNPFLTSTSISFALDQPQNVLINIFDEKGIRIKNLVDARFEKGQHELKWNSENIATGTYLLQFVSEDYASTKVVSVIK